MCRRLGIRCSPVLLCCLGHEARPRVVGVSLRLQMPGEWRGIRNSAILCKVSPELVSAGPTGKPQSTNDTVGASVLTAIYDWFLSFSRTLGAHAISYGGAVFLTLVFS